MATIKTYEGYTFVDETAAIRSRFIDLENVGLDSKVMLLDGVEVKLLPPNDFKWTPYWKIQDGRHNNM